MEMSQNSNHESNLSKKWNYHKIIKIKRNKIVKYRIISTKNPAEQNCKIPHKTCIKYQRHMAPKLEQTSHAKRRENNGTDAN